MAEEEESNTTDFNRIRHDIRNQLSNITLCLEQLKYELPVADQEVKFYFETIDASCKHINELLKKTEVTDNSDTNGL